MWWYLKEKLRPQYRKLRLTTVGDPPRLPRDTLLSTKVGIKFRRQVAVAQYSSLAAKEFVCWQNEAVTYGHTEDDHSISKTSLPRSGAAGPEHALAIRQTVRR
jgi:hypothetical protein